jgi:hypothetical protein
VAHSRFWLLCVQAYLASLHLQLLTLDTTWWCALSVSLAPNPCPDLENMMQIEQIIQRDTQTQHTFQHAAFEDYDTIAPNEVNTHATPKEPFADANQHI